ncbi:peptidoglycan editing factor PgeF [Pseudoalteromonas sp. SSDWG2]|uniref:peptidoglycan editing factor PgeF n=1 Tax=Pseudoalteromonas sp. SSDWG2 TaxID=3139391 RepID=UPI003BA9A508
MKSSKSDAFFTPRWQAPNTIGALQTMRSGGFSESVYDSFNLGNHVDDAPDAVAKNRALLDAQLPAPARYVNQVHGTHIHIVLDDHSDTLVDADGQFTACKNVPLAIMTADCLPVLLASDDGKEIAALHCGWRSLAGGIIEKALPMFSASPANICAWLGPAIGSSAFEVGAEVRSAFIAHNPEHVCAFKATTDKYLADLPMLAKQKLTHLGVTAIDDAAQCTYTLNERYFSYRRDGQTGRMASVIWRK